MFLSVFEQADQIDEEFWNVEWFSVNVKGLATCCKGRNRAVFMCLWRAVTISIVPFCYYIEVTFYSVVPSIVLSRAND